MGKVYTSNTVPMENSREMTVNAPIDNRFVVLKREDLVNVETWFTSNSQTPKVYDGLFVSVVRDPNQNNNGVYYLLRASRVTKFSDVPSTDPSYDVFGWKKIGGDVAFDEYTIQLNTDNERYVATVDGGQY